MDLFNYVSKYIKDSKIKAVKIFNVEERKITYNPEIKNSKGIKVIRGEEEAVRAFLVTKLTNEYGYALSDIEFERPYSAGKPKKIKPIIDIILKHPKMKSIFYFIEIKAPNRYDLELESAIEEQLYKLAGLENDSIDNLVYYSLHPETLDERAFIIDYKKFSKYVDWNNNRSFSNKIATKYGVHGTISTLSYDDKIIDTIVENVIREFNEHAHIKEIPFALRFIAYSELALLDNAFSHHVNTAFFGEMTTSILLTQIQAAVERYLSTIKIAESKKVINDLGIENSVLLTGFQKNPFKFIKKSQVYIMTSLFEGFPNALVEAMACGCPVISTDCKSGPKEILLENFNFNNTTEDILFGDYGILVPVFKEGENWDSGTFETEEYLLSEAMISLLRDKEKLKYYSRKSIERAKTFNYERCFKKYKSLIEEV